jgi:hypothetical protein
LTHLNTGLYSTVHVATESKHGNESNVSRILSKIRPETTVDIADPTDSNAKTDWDDTIETFDVLCFKEYGYKLDTHMFGYASTEELFNDIEELCVSFGNISFDWGHWP